MLAAQGIEGVIMKPILEYGQKLLNDQLVVKKILSETEFIVHHEELRTNLVLKLIANDENIDKWIRLTPHTNVINCFHTFYHNEGDKVFRFSLAEMTKQGDMYRYISSLNLNLGINIPLHYMETIYDCMI